MPYTEVKTEVVIDRITSAAMPRQLERVPAGAEFGLFLILNVFEGDEEIKLLNKVYEGLTLVQNDYLGGKGTSGSGEVSIVVNEVSYKDRDCYEQKKDWQKYPDGTPTEIPSALKGKKENIKQ